MSVIHLSNLLCLSVSGLKAFMDLSSLFCFVLFCLTSLFLLLFFWIDDSSLAAVSLIGFVAEVAWSKSKTFSTWNKDLSHTLHYCWGCILLDFFKPVQTFTLIAKIFWISAKYIHWYVGLFPWLFFAYVLLMTCGIEILNLRGPVTPHFIQNVSRVSHISWLGS